MLEQEIRNRASQLSGSKKLGCHKWFNRFMEEHPNLSRRTPSTLDLAKANALNKSTVKNFYDLVEKCSNEMKLTDERIWNMDEKGFSGDSSMKGKKVIAPTSMHHVNQIKKPCFSKHISVMAIVSASGKALKPIIIFEGKRIRVDCLGPEWDGIKISMQKNGYFTKEMLTEVFDHIDEHLIDHFLLFYGSIVGNALAAAKAKGIKI